MKKPFRSQKGFTLAELMVVIAISIVLAGYKLYPMYLEARASKTSAQGVQIGTLGNTVATYSTELYGPLVNGTSVPGVANIYAPTIAELQSLGRLSANFSANNMYGGSYAVQITKSPAGCVAPNCDIDNLVYLTKAITNPANGRVDAAALGQMVQALAKNGIDAGYSDSATPGTITGANGQWSVPNPVTNAGVPVAGILAVRSGYKSSALGQFMRRDGQLPATGAQDMGGQNVNNVNGLNSATITNTGAANVGGSLSVNGLTSTNGLTNSGNLTNTGAATIGGTLGVSGLTTTAGLTNNGNLQNNGHITNSGNLTNSGTAAITGATTLAGTLAVSGTTTAQGIVNTGTISSTSHISTNGDVQTSRLYLRTVVANGASCAGLTGYQASTAAGSIASCINGTWQTPAANIPPPSPCNATTVSFSGCSGSLPYTQHGSTANVTVTSGSGSATYSCNNGSWAFLSGSCTPPPAGCGAQYVYWNGSASCSGYASAMSSGSGQWVNSSGSGTGSAYATCNNGSISVSSASCSTPSRTFYNPTANNGAYLSSNPANRTQFCLNQGYSSSSGGAQSDFGGTNMPVCWAIDGNNNCTGGGNCTTMAFGNPGCYVQTSVTCQ
jgi:prepilin-type N-terminal cleavage/methylation domain-containing protein